MEITKEGIDMSMVYVKMACNVCGAEWRAEIEDLHNLYNAGGLPKPGESRQLEASCDCPNCHILQNQSVDLYSAEINERIALVSQKDEILSYSALEAPRV